MLPFSYQLLAYNFIFGFLMSTSGTGSFMRWEVANVFATLVASANLVNRQRTRKWFMTSIITKERCHFPSFFLNFTRMTSRAEPVAAELNGRSQSPSHQCEETDDLPVQSKPTLQYGEDTDVTMSAKNRREKKRV